MKKLIIEMGEDMSDDKPSITNFLMELIDNDTLIILIILLFLALLPIVGGPAWGATYTVCTSGCDETDVETVLDNNVLAPGDTIRLDSDITEPDSCSWGSTDDGSAAGYVTLDLNGYTWTTDASTFVAIGPDTQYIKIKNGIMKAGALSGIFVRSVADGTHLVLEQVVLDGDGQSLSSFIDIDIGVDDSWSGIEFDGVLMLGSGSSNGFYLGEDTSIAIRNTILIGFDSAGIRLAGSDNSPTLDAQNVVLYDCLIGIDFELGVVASDSSVYNTIFHSCTTGVLDQTGGADPDMDYNDWYNNTADVANCSKGANALAVDPRFFNAGGDLALHYRISRSSSCANAGATGVVTTDYRNWTRDSQPDIGAFEAKSDNAKTLIQNNFLAP